MIRKEQKQIEAAIRESLKDSQPSQPEERAAVSAQASSPRRPDTTGNSGPKDTMVDDTPSTSEVRRKPPLKQSRCDPTIFHMQKKSLFQTCMVSCRLQ